MVHTIQKTKPDVAAAMGRKRKLKAQAAAIEPKNIRLHGNKGTDEPMTVDLHKNETADKLNTELKKNEITDIMSPIRPKSRGKRKKKKKKTVASEVTQNEMSDRFPILKNSDLVSKFMKVSMNNNQKGRIRQLLKDSLKGTSNVIMPEVINTKILNILKSANDLTDTELRKIRILYNMLKTASVEQESLVSPAVKKSPEVKIAGDDTVKKGSDEKAVKKTSDEKTKVPEKVKGPRRHIVFVGNLPHDVTKEKLMEHFSEISKDIVDIRLPKPEDEMKSAIAYIEIKDDHNYEFALSKHHTMLGNRRINVLYTTGKDSKVSKAEAKSKSAKMIALQKQGKLLGSVPLIRKRSQRRKKMKVALAKAAAVEEANL